MNIIEIPRTVLRAQYRIARLPLDLFEQRVMSRMDTEAPARLLFERSLGALDAAAGNMLGDPQLRRNGVALAQRSADRGRAAQLDAQAAAQQEQADAQLRAVSQEAAVDRSAARAEKDGAVEDAREQAQQRRVDAAQTAQKRTAAAKRNAEETAAKLKDSRQATEAAELERINTAEKNREAAAQSKLAASRDKQKTAREQRVQADRIEDLQHAEKHKRQSERARDS
ncbi:IF2 family translation initiation factor [Mycobacterium sp. AMU20-3851]|uniref:IF2 family translation initiation factor n=1 Tax=Mycobacterium sp. AMU20-3851 TaxID=3122055 RepID=UPI00375533DB